jgi:hypothetical protein
MHKCQLSTFMLAQLREILATLGTDGGHVSPSIYDTAQFIRLGHGTSEQRRQMIRWLLDQQHTDGGWGPIHAPSARELPTVAALLALHTSAPTDTQAQQACAAGRAWLAQQPDRWSGSLPDDIPVALELLLPPLISQAEAVGLIEPRPIRALAQLGERRRHLLAQFPLQAGGKLSHSWEALGVAPSTTVQDGSGGIGHSPTATAAWLSAAQQAQLPTSGVELARNYLCQASHATHSGISGVQPTVWPIDGFECCWVLHALGVAGLLNHPQLRDLVAPHLRELRRRVGATGMGMSHHFISDGDITATALATLMLAGESADLRLLDLFAQGDHYRTYPHELQPSLTTTAHAVHARALAGLETSQTVRYLLQRQQPDGSWKQDKWHSSWIYTTGVVVLALAHTPEVSAHRDGLQALVAAQHTTGGWGITAQPTLAETAYAHLALSHSRSIGRSVPGIEQALARSELWLQAQIEQPQNTPHLWIGKELYTPTRVDAAYICATILAFCLHSEQLVTETLHFRKVG